jgi:hypothetical protein
MKAHESEETVEIVTQPTLTVSATGRGLSAIYTFAGSGWPPMHFVGISVNLFGKQPPLPGSFLDTEADHKGTFKNVLTGAEAGLPSDNLPEGAEIEFQAFSLPDIKIRTEPMIFIIPWMFGPSLAWITSGDVSLHPVRSDLKLYE